MDAKKRTEEDARLGSLRTIPAGPRMRVAVTCDQSGDISGYLGNCTRLLLAEVEGGAMVSARTGEVGPGGLEAGDMALDALAGCTHVICKGVGPRTADRLRSRGVIPYVVDRPMAPAKAVEALLKGQLRPSGGIPRGEPPRSI